MHLDFERVCSQNLVRLVQIVDTACHRFSSSNDKAVFDSSFPSKELRSTFALLLKTSN